MPSSLNPDHPGPGSSRTRSGSRMIPRSPIAHLEALQEASQFFANEREPWKPERLASDYLPGKAFTILIAIGKNAGLMTLDNDAGTRPELVTGGFTGHFSNGSAVGAYVAKEQ